MSDKSTGLWPTLRAMPGNYSTVNGKRYETSLQSMARRGLMDTWPTPQGYARGKPTNSVPGLTPLDIAVRGMYAPPASQQLTLFAEAFPVSPIVSPADAAPPPTIATSGRSSPDLFASCDPDGSWRKMYPDCSPVRLDGSSVPFSETWPRAGMTRSGRAYQLQPLVRLTDETASGSSPIQPWATPNATDAKVGLQSHQGRALAREVKQWPTPCAEDAKNVPYQKGDHGTRYPMLLGAVAPERMWPKVPTPQARDSHNRSGQAHRYLDENRYNLQDYLASQGTGGSLNPTWVEWLMGYPLGWTACAAWATRSSRKSRNGSRGASSPPKG